MATDDGPWIHDAPMAATTDGTMIANVHHLLPGDEPQELLDQAMATGRAAFIGVAIDEVERAKAMKSFDDASAEIVATVVKVG